MDTIPLTGIQIWVVVKILAVILLGMYLIFSLVIVRQVKLMTDTLQLGFERTVRGLAFAHLAFAVLVLLAAIIVL
ncbi:MAG TPA: DUF5657 family protein [Patescibacteria group bacterium]|nr:DUF5657 family protein [Patescibacteria group bacterium]